MIGSSRRLIEQISYNNSKVILHSHNLVKFIISSQVNHGACSFMDSSQDATDALLWEIASSQNSLRPHGFWHLQTAWLRRILGSFDRPEFPIQFPTNRGSLSFWFAVTRQRSGSPAEPTHCMIFITSRRNGCNNCRPCLAVRQRDMDREYPAVFLISRALIVAPRTVVRRRDYEAVL